MEEDSKYCNFISNLPTCQHGEQVKWQLCEAKDTSNLNRDADNCGYRDIYQYQCEETGGVESTKLCPDHFIEGKFCLEKFMVENIPFF